MKMNDWDKHFLSELKKIPVGDSKVFYWISGGRKGMATKLPDGCVRWLPVDVGTSNAVTMTLGECVEQFGYH
jgi:hypothetical protein